MDERAQWQREVRAKKAEERLPDPALEGSRPLAVSDLPITAPRPRQLLRVSSGYFVAGAVWEKIGGVWSCTKAAPIIKWMRGKTPDQVKVSLLKMGASYQFMPIPHVQGSSDGVNA